VSSFHQYLSTFQHSSDVVARETALVCTHCEPSANSKEFW